MGQGPDLGQGGTLTQPMKPRGICQKFFLKLVFKNIASSIGAIVSDPMLLFRDADLKKEFLNLNFAELKALMLTSAVPPPNAGQLPDVIVPDVNVHKHVCFDRLGPCVASSSRRTSS